MYKSEYFSSVLILLAVLCTLPSQAFAVGSTGSSKITKIDIFMAAGGSQILVSGTWSNPDNCQAADYVVISMSDPIYKDVEAALLATYAAGIPVTFLVSGCTTSAAGTTAPQVYAIELPSQ
jgi:hypothetical protein